MQPSSEQSDTPRTDAAIYEEDTGYNGIVKVVSPDFSRELERENARLREAAKLAWYEMRHTSSPRDGFTEALDALDKALFQ